MDLSPLTQHVTEQNLQLRRLVVRQHNEVIAERSFPGDLPEQLWSVSKTFTAMAIGMAQAEGHFGIHDNLLIYFPAFDKPGFDRLTIRDLLCMGTGQTEDPLIKARDNGRLDESVETLFLSEPIRHVPGTHFMYNNAATYLLSRLITQTTGQSLLAYLTPRLFEPLGITNVSWLADEEGINFGCMGLNLEVHDLSKSGQLMLDMGQWQGQQLVPADYIREATRPQISTTDFKEHFVTADHTGGYGYQLWMNRVPGTYRMDGLYAQLVVVLPQQDAVVTMISNEPEKMTAILDLTWQFMLPQL